MQRLVLISGFIDGPGGEVDGDGSDEVEYDDAEDCDRIGA